MLFTYKIKDQLPNLKAIVQYKGTLAQEYPDVYEVNNDNILTFNDHYYFLFII